MQVNRIALEFALADMQQKLATIENINNGGCGFVAYYLYSKIKSLGFNCNIVVAEYNQNHKDRTIPEEKRFDWFGDWHHVLVEIEYNTGNYALVDAEEIYEGDRFSFKSVNNNHCNPESLFAALDDYDLWNRDFDRSNVPTIIEYIDSISFN